MLIDWFTVAAHSGHPAAAQQRDRLKWRLDAHIVSAAEERAAGIISELEAGPASSTAP